MSVRTHWGVVLSLVVLFAACAVSLAESFRAGEGHFFYLIDDAYIHLAVSKNLALHGVWGVRPTEFSSSASSLLWPVLNAAVFLIVGPHAWVPLVLNVLFAGLLLVAIACVFRAGQAYVLACLLAVIYLTPVPTMIFLGMEHMLQILLSFGFKVLAARALTAQERLSLPLYRFGLPLLSALVAAVRYEGLFMVAAVAGLLALRKRFGLAMAIVAGGALPVVAFGLYFMAQGGYFLPNSVLLKAHPLFPHALGEVPSFLQALAGQAYRTKWVSLLVAFVALAAVRRRKKGWDALQAMNAVFLGTAALHYMLGSFGWFYRYEAYLVTMGLVLSFLLLHEIDAEAKPDWRRWLVFAVAALVLYIPGLKRANEAWVRMAPWMRTVYLQHYQPEEFLRAYYPGDFVVIHDIGVIDFYSPTPNYDVYGLGSNEAARAHLEGVWSADYYRRVASKASIVLGCPQFFSPPSGWTKVGEWRRGSKALICFYAEKPAEQRRLAENLRRFAPRLPTDLASRILWKPAEPAAAD